MKISIISISIDYKTFLKCPVWDSDATVMDKIYETNSSFHVK